MAIISLVDPLCGGGEGGMPVRSAPAGWDRILRTIYLLRGNRPIGRKPQPPTRGVPRCRFEPLSRESALSRG